MRVYRFLSVLVLLLLTGCGIDYDDLAEKRQQYAMEGHGDIVIVAIDEPWAKTYLEGIKLAVKQLNEREEKLIGRRVKLLVKTGNDDFNEVRGTIIDIAKNPAVTAVLGHHKTEVAIPASVIYETSQVIFMPPLSSGKDTTTHNFEFVFRMVPHNGVMAEQLASVARLLGYKKVALLYSFGYSRRELAFLFEDAAIEQGIRFVARRSFSSDATDYRDLIAQFSKMPLDMVFLSTDTQSGARMIRQLREMGVTAPIMGGSSLNLGPLKEAAGDAGNNTIVPLFYRPKHESQINQDFIAAYQQLYGKPPDQNAAQGFDSVRLLASAIEQAKSTVPMMIATTLHHIPYWLGTTGVHSYDSRGDVVGKKYFFQVLRDGQWHILPAVHIPYLLGQFDQVLRSDENRTTKPPNFSSAFSGSLEKDSLRLVQLDFLHETLGFKTLGVVYAEDLPGNEPVPVAKMRVLGQKRNFRVEACGVSISDTSGLEANLIRCYGKLSMKVDALNIYGLGKLDKDLIGRVQKPTIQYKIPIFALQGDAQSNDGLSIRVGKFGDIKNIQSEVYINLFEGVLRNMKVYELAEKVKNLPTLEVNLQALNDYGLLRSSPIVGLAPDSYLEWSSPYQQALDNISER